MICGWCGGVEQGKWGYVCVAKLMVSNGYDFGLQYNNINAVYIYAYFKASDECWLNITRSIYHVQIYTCIGEAEAKWDT